MANAITTDELASQAEQFQIIDARRRPDFDASPGMISRAVWCDPENVDNWKANLDPQRLAVVYCVHGRQVSQGCSQALEQAGFSVRYLAGGYEKWAAERKPLVTKMEGRGQ
jgi:rhodanese-related sulfurtransferase